MEFLFITLCKCKLLKWDISRFIYEAAEKRHLSAYIPCHADLPCQTFALPDHREKGSQGHARKYPDRPRATDLTNLSVVAGHFGWATWRNLPQCSPANASNVAGARRSYYGFSDLSCRPSCFAMARHPVQRAISFYYQRIFRAEDSIGFFRQLKHLSVEELTAMIENELSVLPSMHMPDTWIYIDEGMSNGACRTMLTYENKMAGKIVSKSIHARTKLPGDYFGRGRRLLFPEERIPDVGNLTEKFDEELVKNAVFNMKHCVIGLQEHWADSLKMVNHWFPWIDTSRDPYRRKLQLVQGQESHELLRAERPDLYDVLVEYNNCDMVLYDAMVKRYEEQVKYLQYLKF